MAARRLEGKACLITGAARGIGATTARIFARERASVAVVDIRDDLGNAVVRAIRDEGGEAIYQRCDVTRLKDVEAMVHAVVGAFGAVHILFNNAGTAIEGSAI